ncbi:MAG: hypothetical protein HQK65_18085 [Desulfamplus sp.]|nr:hypothetical protein [Desulfamplus sp.]
MTILIDIVNFNADASCLDSQKWLSYLSGGKNSQFCKWLSLYITHRKRMVLGLTGATLSDLYMHNPEAIIMVKNNPDIFQIIIRPYAHDIALLRTVNGFRFNLAAGLTVLNSIFGSTTAYYLPPEFMITNEQIYILSDFFIKAVFVNASRYSADLADRIPNTNYNVKGIFGTKLGCIPVDGELTRVYLESIQLFETEKWHNTIDSKNRIRYLWRDGESSFLLPFGIEREEFWLTNCHAEREHLGNEKFVKINNDMYQSYPIHSFSEWMKELRMMGYLGRIDEIEKQLKTLPKMAQYIWLRTINSDILSSVEKSSPRIHLRFSASNLQSQEYRIMRSERGFEGEEYLAILCQYIRDEKYPSRLMNPEGAHLIKAKGRIEHLKSLGPIWNNATHYL